MDDRLEIAKRRRIGEDEPAEGSPVELADIEVALASAEDAWLELEERAP